MGADVLAVDRVLQKEMLEPATGVRCDIIYLGGEEHHATTFSIATRGRLLAN